MKSTNGDEQVAASIIGAQAVNHAAVARKNTLFHKTLVERTLGSSGSIEAYFQEALKVAVEVSMNNPSLDGSHSFRFLQSDFGEQDLLIEGDVVEQAQLFLGSFKANDSDVGFCV